MKRLVLEGFESPSIDSALGNPHVLKLVREVNYRYGLEAYAVTEKDSLLGRAKVHMGTKNGLPVCTVYANLDTDDAGDDVVIYNIHQPWRSKERGSSEEDRETYRSKKLNVLMATLQKFDVMPKENKILDRLLKPLTGTVYRQVSNSYGSLGKDSLPAEISHALLKRMFGEADDSIYGTLDRTFCKGILDKYNEVDEAVKEREETIQRIWAEPFYAIGVNNGKNYIVGKAKIVFTPTPYGSDRSVEVVEPFRRMKSLYEIEELRGILTMLKIDHDRLASENRVRMAGSDFLIPIQDHYNRDMEVVYGYDSVTRYDRQWMVIPCTAL